MARSYKKYPMVKDRARGMKAIANRTVRRRLNSSAEKFPDGNAYRRIFESYDISDWALDETYGQYTARAERYRKEYENGVARYGRLIDYSEGMSRWDWFKMYKRK